jgi:hypothetical protein
MNFYESDRNFRNLIIGQFPACPASAHFLTLYRKLIDMDLTQTIHVPRLTSSKRFQYPKNRILKSNISQLPFSPLPRTKRTETYNENPGIKFHPPPTLTATSGFIPFPPKEIHLLFTGRRTYPLQLPGLIHKAWHDCGFHFLVVLLAEFTLYSIVKILFFQRETTQFLHRKPPRKNPSNAIQA